MKIVVAIKEVPDTWGERRLDLETGLTDRGASAPVLDEIGERAVETALAYADAHEGTEVVVLTMAPASATATVRKALAMGATSAVHVVDDTLRGADLLLTAEVLAAAIRRTGFDLVIAGNLSTDGGGAVVPAMIAEILGVPQLTALSSLDVSEAAVAGDRVSDAGTMRVSAALPAVVSITEALPEGRFTTFKGIMAAKKKPYETLDAEALGVEAENPAVPRYIMLSVAERPPRAAGTKIVDEGDAGEKLAAFLVAEGVA
ncbi:electron transfer flavoprotein subunit beta/FixA family protein [Microbacterium sp. CFBP 8790]|uniref:electron transfer flavoprotein subunit beta/FixA family protein n=1 Tax=unclassified Microbacterium TaxID=2609290 RepID=UPI00177FF57C|nr:MULTISPECIES: electron transfer flavoprotein subunit beta/FixA family protein [unclassified Microbacterium]MBD8205805.1 electron transfer flavoprotein subunit beta/FixA family protein [Microbacterium sp. CFBP 8801]MBD8509379.1 electron transfer flavoprotein subunit beta/FixA family protein [Microbacterium sp. CFBP 8790]